jgi:hypothetical protein
MSDPPTPAGRGRDQAEVIVGVLVYAYGRRGLGHGRWHDIAAVVPEPDTGTYRILVAEIPAEVLQLWRVTGVSRTDARRLLEQRARRFLAAEDFGADSVRMNNLDEEGLAATGRFDRTMDSALDWALTVERNARLEEGWAAPQAASWRRATLSDSPADRAGSTALVAVHGMIHTAQRLAAAPPEGAS